METEKATLQIKRSTDGALSGLTLRMDGTKHVEEFKVIFRRALNTLEPEKVPPWILRLSDMLEHGRDITPKGRP